MTTLNEIPGAHVFDGVRIADFAWVGVGPNATMQMAFHGAEVIRVESSHRPDTFRSGGPRPAGDGTLDASAYFAKFNRGKRSVAINLAHPRGAEVAKRLIATADIVTESFAPGFMERIGLSYEEVRKIKPDVIMCSMSMEGQTGPHAKFRGFGLTLQATAGVTGVTGWPDRPPVGTGVAYTDWVATHVGIIGILAALDHRRRTGEGQYIDLSQLEASTLVLDAGVIDAANTGRVCQAARQPRPAPRAAWRLPLRRRPHRRRPVGRDRRHIRRAVAPPGPDHGSSGLARVRGALSSSRSFGCPRRARRRDFSLDVRPNSRRSRTTAAGRRSSCASSVERPRRTRGSATRPSQPLVDQRSFGDRPDVLREPRLAPQRDAAAHADAVPAARPGFRVRLPGTLRLQRRRIPATHRRRRGRVAQGIDRPANAPVGRPRSTAICPFTIT